ncbi:hypothetical protein LC085_09490 [Bacillus tianshenii]|uniref:hypothetical protein n=1 Tax=Sutcliffiella tianshenii TaxID=1463404 RepID=UPI001CD1BD82|nr:hypothetical protein [Bacillus tianshenii]MCA1320136.1 hypothetical protein [Bacillus tianshenii]
MDNTELFLATLEHLDLGELDRLDLGDLDRLDLAEWDQLDLAGWDPLDSLGLCRMGNHGLVHKDNHSGSGNGQRLLGNLGGALMDSLIRTALTSNALTDVMQTIPTIQQCTHNACSNACNNLG